MSEESLNELISRLSDRSGLVRERARLALVLKGSESVHPLLELLETSTKRLRWETAKTLAAIADPDSVPALVRLLSDSDAELRWIAATGLARMGARPLPEILRALKDDPESIELRQAVHHVLHDLARKDPTIEEHVAPVLEVLGDTDPAATIPPRAERALKRLETNEALEALEW